MGMQQARFPGFIGPGGVGSGEGGQPSFVDNAAENDAKRCASKW